MILSILLSSVSAEDRLVGFCCWPLRSLASSGCVRTADGKQQGRLGDSSKARSKWQRWRVSQGTLGGKSQQSVAAGTMQTCSQLGGQMWAQAWWPTGTCTPSFLPLQRAAGRQLWSCCLMVTSWWATLLKELLARGHTGLV